MFPKRVGSSHPPKGEATVMKQAAELLEEALREAGGSIEDVGTNPLFSGSAAAPEALADTPLTQPLEGASSLRDGGDHSTQADPNAPTKQDDAANARAMVAAMAPGPIQRRRSDALLPTREPMTADGQRSTEKRAAVAEHEGAEAIGERKKGGALKWLLLVAAALGATALAFRDKIMSTVDTMRERSSPSLASPAPPPTPVVATASAATASASATPEPAASASAPAPSAAASSGSSAAPAVSSIASSMPPPHGAQPLFTQRPAAAAPPPVYAPPRPRPAPAPAVAAAAPPESTAAPTSEAPSKEPEPTTPPVASASSAPAPAATGGASGASTTSKSRSSGRSSDDNPY
jgi:hypothetical protein